MDETPEQRLHQRKGLSLWWARIERAQHKPLHSTITSWEELHPTQRSSPKGLFGPSNLDYVLFSADVPVGVMEIKGRPDMSLSDLVHFEEGMVIASSKIRSLITEFRDLEEQCTQPPFKRLLFFNCGDGIIGGEVRNLYARQRWFERNYVRSWCPEDKGLAHFFQDRGSNAREFQSALYPQGWSEMDFVCDIVGTKDTPVGIPKSAVLFDG